MRYLRGPRRATRVPRRSTPASVAPPPPSADSATERSITSPWPRWTRAARRPHQRKRAPRRWHHRAAEGAEVWTGSRSWSWWRSSALGEYHPEAAWIGTQSPDGGTPAYTRPTLNGVDAAPAKASNTRGPTLQSLLWDIAMLKRALLVLAMVGVYVWIRRQQQAIVATQKDHHAAEAEWANEGGANPSASV